MKNSAYQIWDQTFLCNCHVDCRPGVVVLFRLKVVWYSQGWSRCEYAQFFVLVNFGVGSGSLCYSA